MWRSSAGVTGAPLPSLLLPQPAGLLRRGHRRGELAHRGAHPAQVCGHLPGGARRCPVAPWARPGQCCRARGSDVGPLLCRSCAAAPAAALRSWRCWQGCCGARAPPSCSSPAPPLAHPRPLPPDNEQLGMFQDLLRTQTEVVLCERLNHEFSKVGGSWGWGGLRWGVPLVCGCARWRACAAGPTHILLPVLPPDQPRLPTPAARSPPRSRRPSAAWTSAAASTTPRA